MRPLEQSLASISESSDHQKTNPLAGQAASDAKLHRHTCKPSRRHQYACEGWCWSAATRWIAAAPLQACWPCQGSDWPRSERPQLVSVLQDLQVRGQTSLYGPSKGERPCHPVILRTLLGAQTLCLVLHGRSSRAAAPWRQRPRPLDRLKILVNAAQLVRYFLRVSCRRACSKYQLGC